MISRRPSQGSSTRICNLTHFNWASGASGGRDYWSGLQRHVSRELAGSIPDGRNSLNRITKDIELQILTQSEYWSANRAGPQISGWTPQASLARWQLSRLDTNGEQSSRQRYSWSYLRITEVVEFEIRANVVRYAIVGKNWANTSQWATRRICFNMVKRGKREEILFQVR